MLAKLFRVRTLDKEISRQVRAALLDSLYSSQASLVVGAVVGGSVAWLIAGRSGHPLLVACAAIMTFIGLYRVVSFSLFKRSSSAMATKWELVYDLGAWANAAIMGLLTLFTITCSDDMSLHLLAACNSTGYAAGAAGRNTGRPTVAIGQLLLSALPLSIALLIRLSLPGALLAFTNILYILVIADVTLQTYGTVLSAFTDRQEKLNLATVYEKLSRTDPLTGIDNRVTLKQNLETLLRSTRSMVALVWIDLDRFKQINDTLGHAAGDVVLNAVAKRLGRYTRKDGMLARFGGDEFIVVKTVATEEAAIAFAESVRRTINRPEDCDGFLVDLSASIGFATSASDTSADDLLRHADMALYEAKSRGRNCVIAFDPTMEEKLLQTKRTENDLRRAIRNNELELYFQPIIDLRTGRTKSCEALLRWHHPIHGSISPVVFIPIAEASGQITEITEWVLNSACANAISWPEDISVGVNISPALLKGRELPTMVHEALMKHGLPPRRLGLEITETALVEDNPNIKVILDTFHKMGIGLSLDDFGTGYSSLSHLCKYRFDTLKIDKSFTADIHRSSEARAVIHAISGIAESLDLTVVAEGIETESQLHYIQDHGCAGGQGYYFAQPMPGAALREFTDEEIVKSMDRRATHEERAIRWPNPVVRRKA
jgi:diguanylate cyclase (GGDEF)-like protein